MRPLFRKLIWRGAFALLCMALGVGIAVKILRSEQLRIMWNTPLYLFDGRHKLHGDPRAAMLDTTSELWIRQGSSGQYVRIIPRAGIELAGEQNLSMSSSREGARTMYKLRPQHANAADTDWRDAAWQPGTNDYLMFFEQRRYSNDTTISYYKDAAYGPGGIFFVDPRTGAHIARGNFSTLYVPAPIDGSTAGPTNWLWAAAANRQYVDTIATGTTAQSTWDTRYWRRMPVPTSRTAPGKPGDMACDGTHLYLYTTESTGWQRVPVDAAW